ncbi:energy-coupled thiamine transporter ThiT [Mesoplasma photuris]|uniref:energy-coupled thiamine transporter ThiT n=1 Tax=Mesoplasma photuris TaxID=217731 RepID=UPI0004E25BF9|nr:energy-coupled thiamine transporter ThiT [Mesoplasma photuris]
MKKIQSKYIWLIINAIVGVILSGLLTWGFTSVIIERLKNETDYANLIVLIISLVIFLLIYILLNVYINLSIPSYSGESKKQLIILSIVTLNIPSIIYFWINGPKLAFRFNLKRWEVYDIVIMGMILGLYLLLDFSTSFIQLPGYVTLSLKFIPIFFFAYISDFMKVFTVTILAGILSYFMPNNFDAGNLAAYTFDYLIPVVAISVCVFIKPNISENKVITVINWLVFVTLPTIIIYFSRVFAGVLFYGEFAWGGYDIWIYSLVLNLFNTTFDYALFLLTVPIICKTLKFLKR